MWEGNNIKTNIKIEDYLNNKFSISAFNLKNKLFKLGIKECKCECCGLTEWLGKPINLELHHIDGNNKNNNLDNLQILYPNCHSYTDNFGGKNQKLNIKKHYCIQCGKEMHNKKSSLCSKECRDKYLYNAEPLTIEKVINIMKTVYNKKDLAIKLNRGYNTVNNFIKENGIEYRFKNDNIKKTINSTDKYCDLLKVFKNCLSFTKTGEYYGVSESFIRKKIKKMGYPYKLNELKKYLNC